MQVKQARQDELSGKLYLSFRDHAIQITQNTLSFLVMKKVDGSLQIIYYIYIYNK